ncbi:MAG TPA: tetratricopeptide repeat protein [Chitinophagaceae bacterium]|nr:tetratricopeptide repeat protein [Chitinophagaceae bacterium]
MENHFEYIDGWFHETLSADDARQFEQKIADDPEFAEEVAFYLSAVQALKDEVRREKKETFRQLLAQNPSITNENREGKVTRMRVYQVAAAAAVLVCVFFAWYLFFSKSATPVEMADNYMSEKFKTLPVTMGTERDSIQDGFQLYNEGKYDSSLQQFETIIQKDTGNYLAKKYTGIVYLRLGNYDKAIEYFSQLEKYSLFANPAIFYHALTLMKRNQPGDKQKAKQLLQQVVDEDLEGKDVAQQWLKKW